MEPLSQILIDFIEAYMSNTPVVTMHNRFSTKTIKKRKLITFSGLSSSFLHVWTEMFLLNFAFRESNSKAEPLIGELYEAWSLGESTSCAGRKERRKEGILYIYIYRTK